MVCGFPREIKIHTQKKLPWTCSSGVAKFNKRCCDSLHELLSNFLRPTRYEYLVCLSFLYSFASRFYLCLVRAVGCSHCSLRHVQNASRKSMQIERMFHVLCYMYALYIISDYKTLSILLLTR